MDTASLVHETYLRLAAARPMQLEDRQHFMCYAGRAMRSVIVDVARAKLASRRGRSAMRVTFGTLVENTMPSGELEILKVHEALEHLAHYGERIVQVVELRYFAGLSQAEIAASLGVTERTVRRDWEKARVLLAEALQ
jgi:RNA polymerase sigma factor (TIGR02999 family)